MAVMGREEDPSLLLLAGIPLVSRPSLSITTYVGLQLISNQIS